MTTVTLDLDSLARELPSLTTSWCNTLAESAIVCLTSQQHQTNIRLPVESNMGGAPVSATLCWTQPVTLPMQKTYRNDAQTTDFGAMALALLLTLNLTEYNTFEVSRIGTGVDYWLSKNDELDFSARLEISGIRKESKKNTINSRLLIKQRQVVQSDDSGFPVYIVIVEFSRPAAAYIQKQLALKPAIQ
jgi:hypothetical protein